MKTQLLSKAREAVKKYKYLLVILAAGILLMLLPFGGGNSAEKPASAEPSYDSFELENFERDLADVLSKMSGVGKTEVVLTLKSTMETVYATDTRTEHRDGSQSEQSETVMANAGSGVQSAVVASRIYPQFQGALVVCDGGGSASVRLEVTRAVAALTGLSSDRITVTRRDAQ